MNIITKFFQHNWLATIYINFKMLPFKQALKLPIDIYYNARFEKLSGKIIIESEKIRRSMIKINARGCEMFSMSDCIISLEGSIKFKGIAEIGHGCFIHISPNAQVTLGDNVRLGAKTKLYCNKEITIGNEVDISWESQIFDTNFHYTKSIETGEIYERDGTIEIADYNWFGNRCSIMKGTKTAKRTVVASNSMTNKNYVALGENCILAGTPAKLVKSGVIRLFEHVDI